MVATAPAAQYIKDTFKTAGVVSVLLTNLPATVTSPAGITNLNDPLLSLLTGTNTAGIWYTNSAGITPGSGGPGTLYVVVSTNIVSGTGVTPYTNAAGRVVASWTNGVVAVNKDNFNLFSSDAALWSDTTGQWPTFMSTTAASTNCLASVYVEGFGQYPSGTNLIWVQVCPVISPGKQLISAGQSSSFTFAFNPSIACTNGIVSFSTNLPAQFIGEYGVRLQNIYTTNVTQVINSGFWITDIGVCGYKP